jgi:hypothetical protein
MHRLFCRQVPREMAAKFGRFFVKGGNLPKKHSVRLPIFGARWTFGVERHTVP